MQQSIFDIMYPKYKITKPIRLIEFFAGYGSQALALKYLGVEFEHWRICEWAVKSIQAYKDIHFDSIDFDFSGDLTKDNLVKVLYELGISSNYNEPMTKKQIERLSEQQLKNIWNNIVTTKNLVNIQQVKGEDLEIVDTDKYDYILTYSFPCQDLSLAGKGKGMSDTSTRSGMLWEVERILKECKKLGKLPQILLMENVPQVHGSDNVDDFNKWQLELEKLGYKNYFEDLIATDYGIPQTRNRCFMISILGDYSYTFPQPIPLKLKLKDMLEDNVDEKYYLSDKMLDYMYGVNANNKFNRKEVFERNLRKTNDENVAATITTAAGQRPTDYFIKIKNATKQGYLEAEDGDGVDISSRMEHHRGTVQKGKTQTITTMGGENNGVVVSDTLKRELCNQPIQDGLVEEGDIVKHSYTQKILDGEKKCVEKNDGNMITLTTRGDCVGVVVGTYQYAKSDNFMQGKDRLQLGKETSDTLQTTPKEGVVTIGNYSPSNHNASRIVDKEYSAPTVMENHGTITAITEENDKANKIGSIYNDKNSNAQGGSIYNQDCSSPTLSTGHGYSVPFVENQLRIRKLTPRECGRLMGVKDEDITNMLKNQSDSSAYHCFGDSIVVNVLMAIFKELLESKGE